MTKSPAVSRIQAIRGGAAVPKTERRPRGRPSLAEAAGLKETFLEVATRSFIDKGFAATSIEAIARDAAVAKITIYRHFSTKETLFKEVVRRALDATREEMRVAFGGESPNVQVRLLEFIGAMCTCSLEPRTLGLMRMAIAEAPRFPELSETVYAANVDALHPLIQFLEDAGRTGVLKVPDSTAVALQLSALAAGGLQSFLSDPLASKNDRSDWAQAVLDLVWSGLQPRH